MKKYIFIFLTVICFTLSANAQWGQCKITGNVEPFVNHGNKTEVGYSLTNKNDYKVTVTVRVIYKGEVVSNEKTHVIDANKRIPSGSYLTIMHWAGEKSDFNKDYLGIKLSVAKCE
ncbi:MAG: hypothetical protein LBP85_05420 [Prevotellaceae bacterium]|nr:hypothetical protein [Prevotellaceae bacterium]